MNWRLRKATVLTPLLAALVLAGLASMARGQSALNNEPAAAKAALILARLPAGAQLWFDGKPTTETGTVRVFALALPPDRSEMHEVKVRWSEAGRTFNRSRRVTVQAGERVNLIFSADRFAELRGPIVPLRHISASENRRPASTNNSAPRRSVPAPAIFIPAPAPQFYNPAPAPRFYNPDRYPPPGGPPGGGTVGQG
jgi:uncharacterized protein (TIGR03000 family)